MPATQDYFRGKHVLLTGGSTGIGLAAAQRLASYGARLTLFARRMPMLEEAKAAILAKTPGATVHLLPLDVADEDAVNRTVAPHIAAHPADVLINNAGIVMPGRFLELDAKHYREQMNVNYFGAVHMCRAVVPQLVQRGGGHVANVGSLLSVFGIYGYSAYCASKFALYGFSDALRGELLPQKVRVTILLPPDTDTPQHSFELQYLPPETKAISGTVKMLTAEQVADALLDGMNAGRFEIVPGMDGRFTVWANRWIPSVVRGYCDMMVKKAKP